MSYTDEEFLISEKIKSNLIDMGENYTDEKNTDEDLELLENTIKLIKERWGTERTKTIMIEVIKNVLGEV